METLDCYIPEITNCKSTYEEPIMIAEGCGSRIVKINSDEALKIVSHNSNDKHIRACRILKNDYQTSLLVDHENLIKYSHYGCNAQQHHHHNHSNNQQDYYTQEESQSCCMLKMPLYDEDLFDFYIKKQGKKTDIVQNITGIVSGLMALHQSGIAHNDVKPENILVKNQNSGQQKVVLADFGCTQVQKLVHDSKEQQAHWKNRELTYAAPEIFQLLEGKNQIIDERKADLFALGQSLFMFVFRCFPRKNKLPNEKCPYYKIIMSQNAEMFYNIIKKNVALPEGWKEEELQLVVDLVLKLMHPDPTQRIDGENLQNHPFFLIRE